MAYRRCLMSVSAIIALVVTANHAAAAIIYVNNLIGDDHANGAFAEGASPSDGPVATIRRALQIARGTDSISIANTGVPYSESVTLDRPELAGSPAYPFIIEGNGAVMRGTKPLPTDVWRRVGEGTYRYQPYRKGHYQLVVNGLIADEVNVDRDASSVPPLRPLEWCALRGLVYLRVEPQKFIDQYAIEAPLFEVGFGFHNARDIVLRNLNIELYRLDGIAVTGNSRNIRLVNVRSTGNGRAGLSVSGTSQVQVGGLDLIGNREAEQLVLLKGRVTELPEAQLPAKPSALDGE